jgi:uncharacterized protein (TIGR00255 family)
MAARIQSMTGQGLAAGPSEAGEVRIEVRTVNGRGFSSKLRLPVALNGYEAAVDELLQRHIARGSVTVVAELARTAANVPDREVARTAAEALHRLAEALQLAPPTLADVLQAAQARSEPLTSRPLPPQLLALLEQALTDLAQRRTRDGAGAAAAIAAELDAFATCVQKARAQAPGIADAYRERLLLRVREFATKHLPEPPPAFDLVREVALFADRVDVAEELQRLDAHLGELRAILAAGGDVGRRFEFLLQELLRETNTLGSKSPDTTIAHTVVAMKSAIDRMKEQAANLQ